MAKPTRWGFMGTGKIANDFAYALKGLPQNEHQIIAVAAGDLKRAQEFAKKFNVKYAFQGYEKLVNCSDVDVIYVNNLSLSHLDSVKLALNAGKAVLCEKPLAVNLRQVKEMVALARQKGVFFMEGFWSRFFPAYEEIRKALKDGRIGEPKIVQANFGVQVDKQQAARLFTKNTRGSAFMDMGCYTVMFSTLIFNGQRPQQVLASGTLNDEGVDTGDYITLKYANGGYAQLTCSSEVDADNRANVFGTKGQLTVLGRFHCPSKLVINGQELDFPLPNINGEYNFDNSEGLAYEAQHVRECLLKGLKESPLMPLEQSEVIMSIMDEVRRQVGVVFPEDSK